MVFDELKATFLQLFQGRFLSRVLSLGFLLSGGLLILQVLFFLDKLFFALDVKNAN